MSTKVLAAHGPPSQARLSRVVAGTTCAAAQPSGWRRGKRVSALPSSPQLQRDRNPAHAHSAPDIAATLSSATATQCMRPPRRLPRPRTRKSALPGGHSYRLSSGKSTAPARCRAPCLQNQPNGDGSARNSRSALPWPVYERSRGTGRRVSVYERQQQRQKGRRGKGAPSLAAPARAARDYGARAQPGRLWRRPLGAPGMRGRRVSWVSGSLKPFDVSLSPKKPATGFIILLKSTWSSRGTP